MSTTNSIDLGSFSKQYAARDLPAHQKLKYRDIGQAGPDEVRKDKKELKKDLDERERIAVNKDSSNKYLSIQAEPTDKYLSKKPKEQPSINLDADEILPDSDSDDETSRKKKKRNNDSDNTESDEEAGTRDTDESEDEEEDEDDDTEALMAELNRIKQERAAEAAKLEAERKAREEKIRVENILKGNPLLNPVGTSKSTDLVDFKVKRRWDDDVVFKNCAKGDVSNNKKRDFINDTLRSEFHKKFMDRYIK